MKHFKNFDLTKYNSFRLHSMTRHIWFPESLKELIWIVKQLKELKFEILGGGTNVLLREQIDKVISLKKMQNIFISLFNKDTILVSCNFSTNRFINKTIKMKLSGLEGLIGIPGLLGGAIVMNAGSGQTTISDFLVGCDVLTKEGNIVWKSKEDLNFQRRYSILQDTKEIVISALFLLDKEKPNKKIIMQAKKHRKNFPKGFTAGGIFVNWHALKPYEKELRAIKSPNLVISKQLNIIINNGKASYKEVYDFISRIRKIVKEPLTLEIKILGEK